MRTFILKRELDQKEVWVSMVDAPDAVSFDTHKSQAAAEQYKEDGEKLFGCPVIIRRLSFEDLKDLKDE